MKRIYKIISVILLATFPLSAFAADTHSASVAKASSQYFSLTDGTNNSPTGDMTLEIWYQPTTQTAGDWCVSGVGEPLFSKYVSTGNQRSFYWDYGLRAGSTYLCFTNSDDGSSTGAHINYQEAAISSVSNGTWTYLAMTFSAGTVKFYQGSESTAPTLKATVTGFPSSIYDGTSAFQVGAISNQAGYLDGLIGEARYWQGTARTLTELQGAYCPESLTGSETNLKGYWKFNNNATDSSSAGQNLTANNSPTYSTTLPTGCTNSGGAPATTAPDDGFIFFMYAPLPDRFVV